MKSKIIILILSALILSGCASDERMRERFAGKTRILTDEKGRKYLVRHNIGDNYMVTPYEPENLK